MKKSLKLRLWSLCFTAVLLLAIIPASAEPVKEEEPQIGADSAVIFNADDAGELLYAKNETLPVYCGFLPRVMTCLLIKESGRNLDETVTITREMLVYTPQRSNVKLEAGDVISLRDLMVCITVGNAQEAAVAAAFALEGSMPPFIEKMNQRAKELGATQTTFTNVTGKYVANTRQITTLQDCSIILSEALKHEEIAAPAAERSHSITVNGKTRTVYTKNYLIETTSSNYNSAAKGLFIYYEESSNGSIATYRKDSDRKIISLAVTTKGLSELYKDAGALLEFSKNRYVTRTLLSENKALAEVKVENGKDMDFAILTSSGSVTALVPKIYNQENAELTFHIPSVVQAPVEAGTVLGTVTVSCGGKVYGTVELKVQTGVELDYFELYSSKIGTFFANPWLWVILAGLIAAVGGYTLLAYKINHPRKKKTPASQTGSRIRMTGGEEDDED